MEVAETSVRQLGHPAVHVSSLIDGLELVERSSPGLLMVDLDLGLGDQPSRDSLVKLLDGNVPRVALKDIPGLTPAAR